MNLPVQTTIRGFSLSRSWRDAPGWIVRLVTLLAPPAIAEGPWDLELPNGRRRDGLALEALGTLLTGGKSGTYRVTSSRVSGWAITLTDYGTELDVLMDGVHQDQGMTSLEEEVRRASAIEAHVRPLGTIGPVYWVSLPSVSYPRPLPPRISAHWVPGVIMYVLSRAFYESGSESVDPSTFQRLETAKLPDEIVRETLHDDLLIIRGRGPLDDTAALRKQLSALESWVGDSLDLPRDQEFLANGDQLWRIWKSNRIPPFSFIDEATRIGYKVVAETAAQEIDAETLSDLRTVLPLRSLPDGRAVESTMVIFAFREGAVRNLQLVRKLGAAGALYRDANGAFWNPDPPGEWLRESP